MGFGDNAISVITGGLRRSTGSFAERLVSSGLVGDIVTAPEEGTAIRRITRRLLLLFSRRRRKR